MMLFIKLSFFCILFFGCDEVGQFIGKDEKEVVTYSFACLDSTLSARPVNRKLDKASDLIRDLAISKKSITDSLQTAYGKEFHQQMTGKEGSFKLVNNPSVQKKLNTVLAELLAARENPSKIEYAIYLLQDTVINAFTFGGRIYITEAMLDKCKESDALLYAIVGHEIGHSEVGHIKTTIQELELSTQIFGDNTGATVFEIKKLLTASFNQKNELEADYYGINLTNKLGYDVCSAVSFWKEMASKENNYNQLEDFFRTHPFSELRAQCLTDHIRLNFGKQCAALNKAASLPQVVSNEKK
jgi:predicted Zn-dependent protease